MTRNQKVEPVADIALLLEGTYPYIRGGVSAWVHQMITGLPEYTFALIFLGGARDSYGGIQYQLPDNVTHFEQHYLMEPHSHEKPRPRKGNCRAFRDQQQLHEQFRQGESVSPELLTRAFMELGQPAGITEEDFLFSQESWRVVQESYRAHCTEPSFVDYFWTVRTMHTPLFQLIKIARNLPDVRALHAISTGYAGLLGAMASDCNDLPFVISEHGIYTKERKIDLAQANWIEDPSDPVSDNLGEPLGYIRRLWIRFFEIVGKLAYQKADSIISLYQGNRRRQLQDGAPEEKTRIIPNGIDPEVFKPALQARKPGIPQVLGLIGRVVPIKDIKTFIRAMRSVCEEIPEAQGWIVGPEEEDPEYVEECRSLVRSLGLQNNILFMGFQQVNDVLPKLGLVVLTSISEALPLVILEANAAGVPCLATDVGACKELIHGDEPEDQALGASGAVVPIADPQATAAGAVRMLRNPEIWYSAQQAGLARVNRYYTLDNMFGQYREVYQQALEKEQGNH